MSTPTAKEIAAHGYRRWTAAGPRLYELHERLKRDEQVAAEDLLDALGEHQLILGEVLAALQLLVAEAR